MRSAAHGEPPWPGSCLQTAVTASPPRAHNCPCALTTTPCALSTAPRAPSTGLMHSLLPAEHSPLLPCTHYCPPGCSLLPFMHLLLPLLHSAQPLCTHHCPHELTTAPRALTTAHMYSLQPPGHSLGFLPSSQKADPAVPGQGLSQALGS